MPVRKANRQRNSVEWVRQQTAWLQSDLLQFSSTLPGKILTDDFADKEGLEMGDEYFANLDHIESVENFKEGYESEAHCSDSEGSGVDVSRIKIQPSALISSNPVGRPPKKSECRSKGWICLGYLGRFSAVFVYLQCSPSDFECFPVAAQSSSSSDESNDDDKDSKSEDESDSSDDTFVKDSYYSSSSVWRSYTTRGQVKGNKEGEQAASLNLDRDNLTCL